MAALPAAGSAAPFSGGAFMPARVPAALLFAAASPGLAMRGFVPLGCGSVSLALASVLFLAFRNHHASTFRTW
ncbi:MAG: hypothetical protein HY520_04320 [Candidatus Aenigmarchaeota archaeon]|nr:hypothetical protein [Candidatus Aenigmarchaeota archaeon]